MTVATATITAATVALTVLLVFGRGRPRVEARPARRAVAPAVPPTSALVDVVEQTSRDVRSGTALTPALTAALRRHPMVAAPLLQLLERGATLEVALSGCRPTPGGDTALIIHGIRLAAETGGAVADTLERVAAVVRERHAWRLERHAQAAQARLSALILTVLPFGVACWGLMSGPRIRDAYAESGATVVATVFGVCLNLTGWWWMRRLVDGGATR